MSIDKEIKKLFEKLQAGELNQNELDKLEEYSNRFPEYKELFKVHQILSEAELPVPEPEPEQFSKMRADILREIRQKEEKVPGRLQLFIENIRGYVVRPEMALAALTLIIGFLLGRALPPDKDNLASDIMDQITDLAQENKKLEDVRKSPLVYSNVAFKEVDQNNISLSFDVTTHLDMIGKKNDPLVREVIAQSLINPSNLGTELKAISYTEGMVDQKIKEALIFSMIKAPIMAVRLKAMVSLSEYESDQEIQEAFIDVLRKEESVKMRLFAIDYLTANKLTPDTLQRVISESEAPQNPALMIKVNEYIEKQ